MHLLIEYRNHIDRFVVIVPYGAKVDDFTWPAVTQTSIAS